MSETERWPAAMTWQEWMQLKPGPNSRELFGYQPGSAFIRSVVVQCASHFLLGRRVHDGTIELEAVN